MAKGRGTSSWVRLLLWFVLTWLVAAAVWLWLVNNFVVQDTPPSLAVMLAVVTALAAFAMFLIRLIGRGIDWFKTAIRR